jgi:hypothetical protein
LSYNGVSIRVHRRIRRNQSTVRFDRAVDLYTEAVTPLARTWPAGTSILTGAEPNALVLMITGLISLALIRPRRSAPR